MTHCLPEQPDRPEQDDSSEHQPAVLPTNEASPGAPEEGASEEGLPDGPHEDPSGAPSSAPDDGADNGVDDETEHSVHAMPLLDHLRELRSRLLRGLIGAGVGFLASYSIVDTLYAEIIRPLVAVMPANSHMIFTVLSGPFFVQLKIALLAGLLLSSPYIFYQIWAFIAPGLYAHERRCVLPLAVVSALFFLLGAAFCYLGVLPFAFQFFLSYSSEFVVAQPDIVEYFDFVLKLILAFGLIFEMPLFALFLARLGLVTAAKLRSLRRYAILTIFIVAAILTPPDPFTQVLMAIPMLVLYEIGILLAAFFGRKPAPQPSPDPGPDSAGDAA